MALGLRVFCRLLGTCVIIFSFPAHAEKDQERIPAFKTFQDIKTIALYVDVRPNAYKIAVDCHGREEECADENGGLSLYPERRKEFIEDLKSTYDLLPKPLHEKNLQGFLTDAIKTKFGPYLLENEDGTTNDIVIIQNTGSEDYNTTLNTLVVMADLTIFDDIEPPVAVLDLEFVRPEHDYANFWQQYTLQRSTAIYLDMTDQEISKQLDALMNFHILSLDEVD